jgi:hypothetical protein
MKKAQADNGKQSKFVNFQPPSLCGGDVQGYFAMRQFR